jgi:signal transduction histidine kinase/pSer/pThr/pTyr-binding forkhead associated (FHA) protein
LIVIKGADEGRQFELDAPALGVGRDAGNAIRLHDTEVSRRHAEFRVVDGGYALADVGSANGTFVNNQPIKETRLQPGDHITIGQSILVYSAGRTDTASAGDLAEQINMISKMDQDLDAPSAIVKTIGETEGSRILARPNEAGTAWLKTALANLSIMYEAIQAVSHILDLDQLLERIMELIFRSIAADRGCIMLRNANGQFEPKAVRWREGVNRQEKITLSRTIMEHVLRERQGVLVTDAAHDERFNPGQSIVRFGIREAICVPMKGRHESLGVLYLDTRSEGPETVIRTGPVGKFTEDHLALAIAIAHQAALAVEETRYHHAMVQAERLAAIGQTIAALSHHIKNILQGLRSGSDILKMGLTDKDDALLQQGWKIFEKNQAKIYDLVMDMLSYSKEREPAIEVTDVNQIVRDVVELENGRAHKHGIRLEMRLDDELPQVQADPEGIHRALLNVVSNALDAVVDRKHPQVGIATALDNQAGWLRIIVLDNGVGIAPEKMPDIFRPFVSSKGSRGTGLGLAVSRKILREHGGDILVQSQSGKGSRFILRLPIKSPLGPDVNASTGSHTALNTPLDPD